MWKATNLKFIPINTCESEWKALLILCKEGMFTVNLLTDMGVKVTFPIVFMTDNKAAYDVIRNHGATKNTVHVERWFMYVRQLYLEGKIRVELISTDDMRADDKTKVVDRKKFEFCRKTTMHLKE